MRLEDYFRGLSDPTRLRIINLLLHNELCGCDLQQLLAIPQPLVSRHLVYLKRSGLVADRRDGFRVFYRLAEGSVVRNLFDFLKGAFSGEEVFTRDVARLREILAEGALPSRAVKPRVTDRAWRRSGQKRVRDMEAGRRRGIPQ